MREGMRDKRKGRSGEGSKRLRLCQKHGRQGKTEHRPRMRGAQNDAAEAIVIKHLGETRVSTRDVDESERGHPGEEPRQ